MCLENAKIKETTEDIVCYKIYYISIIGELRSPYMKSLAPNMNEIAKTRLGELYGDDNCINAGFHSFATLEDAIEEKKIMLRLGRKVIIKCIIPKNSKCYVGSFWGRTSYCSESIILKEIYEVN